MVELCRELYGWSASTVQYDFGTVTTTSSKQCKLGDIISQIVIVITCQEIDGIV